MRIALIDRTRVGLLFGWSWFPAEDENDFEELNLYFFFFGWPSFFSDSVVAKEMF